MAVVVQGYREFLKATQYAPKDVKKQVRDAFRKTGRAVRDDAERNFSAYGATADARRSHSLSADGYRVAVRQTGVDIESSRRKTTGRHPEYGDVQMRRGLIPAARENTPWMVARMELAMEEVVDLFERRAD
jgi:hypothetical protein